MCHCEERSDEAIPSKDEIAAPFGLAMTVTIIISFVLVLIRFGHSYFEDLDLSRISCFAFRISLRALIEKLEEY